MCKTDKWINKGGISRKWSTSNKKKKARTIMLIEINQIF